MLTLSEKTKYIQQTDCKMQDHEDAAVIQEWERAVCWKYDDAKGNEYGWEGISEKDPDVINEVYDIALDFNARY